MDMCSIVLTRLHARYTIAMEAMKDGLRFSVTNPAADVDLRRQFALVASHSLLQRNFAFVLPVWSTSGVSCRHSRLPRKSNPRLRGKRRVREYPRTKLAFSTHWSHSLSQRACPPQTPGLLLRLRTFLVLMRLWADLRLVGWRNT